MELLPEWAPNLHPMIVHFPIALILAAIGADLLSMVVRRWEWTRPATVALYLVGGASTVVTYVTGTWAAGSVTVTADAQSVLTEHANLGWWTMWFFGVYALVRLGARLWPRTRGRAVRRAGGPRHDGDGRRGAIVHAPGPGDVRGARHAGGRAGDRRAQSGRL